MRPQRVAIVDYGMCNLDSVKRAFEEVGARPFVTDEPGDLDSADRIVSNVSSNTIDNAAHRSVVH